MLYVQSNEFGLILNSEHKITHLLFLIIFNQPCEFDDLDSIATSNGLTKDQLRYIFTNMMSSNNYNAQLLISGLREYDNLRMIAMTIGITIIELKHILINEIN